MLRECLTVQNMIFDAFPVFCITIFVIQISLCKCVTQNLGGAFSPFLHILQNFSFFHQIDSKKGIRRQQSKAYFRVVIIYKS